jgi:hypothetical protein
MLDIISSSRLSFSLIMIHIYSVRYFAKFVFIQSQSPPPPPPFLCVYYPANSIWCIISSLVLFANDPIVPSAHLQGEGGDLQDRQC